MTFDPQVSPAFGGQLYPPAATTTLTDLETLFPPEPDSTTAPSVYLKAGLYRRAAPTTPAHSYVLHHDDLARYEQAP